MIVSFQVSISFQFLQKVTIFKASILLTLSKSHSKMLPTLKEKKYVPRNANMLFLLGVDSH